MALLRLIGDILIYLGIGLAVYAYFNDNYTILSVAIGSIIIGGLILLFTPNRRKHSRRRNDSGWDLFDFIELPFDIIGWLFRGLLGIFRIFD